MGYSVFVALGFAVAFAVKRLEERRLGYDQERRPGYRFVALGALIGGVVGSKIGMLLYVPTHAWVQVLKDSLELRFDGKTIIGGLAGGYAGVEGVKKLVGLKGSTGDAFALAIPLGQAVGRLGCFVAGCCYGAPSGVPWAIWSHGSRRHPVQLYDSFLCLLLAAVLWALRRRLRPPGRTFKVSLVLYAAVRFALDPLRGDERMMLGWLSMPQWFCLGAMALLGLSLRRKSILLPQPRVAEG